MTIRGVIIVARPVKIRGHQADCVEAVLYAQRFAKLDPGDLGDSVPLIRGLKRASEQRLLFNRLLSKFRIDAATTQKQQTPHTRAPGRFDHMSLDFQVVQQKVCRVAAVGLNTAHLGGSEHDHCGSVLGEPGIHRTTVEQIELRTACGEELVVATSYQGSADGTAGHAAVACYKDLVRRNDQGAQASPPTALIASTLVGGFSIEPITAKPLRLR